MTYDTDRRLYERIAELERRCADKDASIAQLIEQLQKAEARLFSEVRAHQETALKNAQEDKVKEAERG
jgi:uncharacterized coiled-coil protein SlyX